MSCDSVTRALSLFLYGELSFEEEEAVHQHLEGCGDCRQALARERALHNALDEVAVNPPADLLAECRGDLRRNLDRPGDRLSAHQGDVGNGRHDGQGRGHDGGS